jgi:glycosyltransferase involved in cell wall biosynthesis
VSLTLHPRRKSTSSRPHVVLATDALDPGGVSHFMLQIATHFRRKGYRISVVALRRGEWDERFLAEGFPVHAPMSPGAVRLIRSADIVHCHQRIAGLLAMALGANSRTIEHVHNEMSDHRLISFRAPNIAVVSERVRQNLLRHYPRLQRKDIKILRGGAPKLCVRPKPYARRDIDIVGIGRMDAQKDPLRFLEMTALCDSRRGAIRAAWLAPCAGELTEHFLDRREALGLGGTVDLVVGQSHSQTMQFLERSKVLLMTSQWEGFPLVAIEAMAAGTPVVTTPCGDISEVVRGGSCGRVLGADSHADARAILAMIGDREIWDSLSENAFTTADQYSEESTMKAVEALYSGVMGSSIDHHPCAASSDRGPLCES